MSGCLSFPAELSAVMYAESCWTPRRCPCTMPGIASTKSGSNASIKRCVSCLTWCATVPPDPRRTDN
jgi:hypothetical protein